MGSPRPLLTFGRITRWVSNLADFSPWRCKTADSVCQPHMTIAYPVDLLTELRHYCRALSSVSSERLKRMVLPLLYQLLSLHADLRVQGA